MKFFSLLISIIFVACLCVQAFAEEIELNLDEEMSYDDMEMNY